MGIFKSFSFMRLLRSVHGWLGFFVLPWIIMIGLTGLYLNHSRLIFSYLPNQKYDESKFDAWPNAVPVGREGAKSIAASVWPEATFKPSSAKTYHKRQVFAWKGDPGRVIVDAKTGHYWVKTRFFRRTYDPNGRLLSSKFYWGTAFKSIHTAGWIDRTLGTWLADITAGAMVVFGSSGIFLFLVPRLRRRKNKKTRSEPPSGRPAENVPRPQRIRLKN